MGALRGPFHLLLFLPSRRAEVLLFAFFKSGSL